MAVLDTGIGWQEGDVERILRALEMSFSRYTINEITVACNELGDIASSQISEVRSLLVEWETALGHQKNAGQEENAGKILVKADVLEWEKEGGGKYESILREKARIRNELEKIFGFSNVIGLNDGRIGARVYRS